VKHYFIVEKEVWDKFPKEQFSQCHWIETDTAGKVLLVAEFPHAGAHDFWESIPGVEPLPHLLFGNGLVEDRHVNHLAKSLGAVTGDDILTIARKAGKIHPAFRPERI